MRVLLSKALFLILAMIGCLSTAYAQAVCDTVLGYGIFNNSSTVTDTATSDRLATVFCRSESQTKESGHDVGAKFGVDLVGILKASGDGTYSDKNYQDFKKNLCYTSNSSHDATFYQNQNVKAASQSILDAWTKCQQADGLKQYLIPVTGSQKAAGWRVVYKPTGQRGTVSVTLNTAPTKACKLNGTEVPANGLKLAVGPPGKLLICSSPPNSGIIFSVNSADAAVTPPLVVLPAALPPQPKNASTEYITLDGPKDMKAPISFALPQGKQCTLYSQQGHWWPHCPNQNVVLGCPSPNVTGNTVTSDFDRGAYADNCGQCTYTFACTTPP